MGLLLAENIRLLNVGKIHKESSTGLNQHQISGGHLPKTWQGQRTHHHSACLADYMSTEGCWGYSNAKAYLRMLLHYYTPGTLCAQLVNFSIIYGSPLNLVKDLSLILPLKSGMNYTKTFPNYRQLQAPSENSSFCTAYQRVPVLPPRDCRNYF